MFAGILFGIFSKGKFRTKINMLIAVFWVIINAIIVLTTT